MMHLRTDLPRPDDEPTTSAAWWAWSCEVRLDVARAEALPLARMFVEDLLGDVGRETGGFRPRHDGHLDLAATARAWVADECAMQIARRLHTPVLLDVGGDVAVRSSSDLPFEVRPVAGDADDVLLVHRGGVASATRADLPADVEPLGVDDLLVPAGDAATVWAPTAVEASAASASLLHLDRSRSFAYLGERGLHARLVARDGRVVRTQGWPQQRVAA